MDVVRENLRRWKILRGFTMVMLVLLSVSVILQSIGLRTRSWMIYITPTLEIHSGLFRYKVCAIKVCLEADTDSLDYKHAADNFIPGIPSLRELQAETITALVFCVITIVVLFVTMCKRSWCRIVFIVACITACTSAILALVAAGQVARLTMKAHDKQDPSPFDFPESVLLTGLGGIFAAFCAMALFAILVSGYSLKDISTHKPSNERGRNPRSRPSNAYYQRKATPPYRPPYHTQQNSPYYMQYDKQPFYAHDNFF